MPDFTARIIGGAVTLNPWVDSPFAAAYVIGGLAPSRINPRPEAIPVYYKVPVAGTTLTFAATTDVGEGPFDDEVEGRFFHWAWVEYAPTGPLAIFPYPFEGSVVDVLVPPNRPGHYLLQVYRDLGGSIAMPFTVE